MDDEAHILYTTNEWGTAPPPWRNFVRYVQEQEEDYDSMSSSEWYNALLRHLKLLHDAERDLVNHRVIFKNSKHKLLFLLKWGYNEPEDED